MTIQEAIKHCKDKARDCDKCSKEHKQLAEWLEELVRLRTVFEKEKCFRHEKHHIVQKQEKTEAFDTSCWYINPYDINNRVINQSGETVKLNTEQTRSDYQFFQDLNLKQNRAFTAYLYECIVYGHNFRNGYIKDRCHTEEEAILTIRLRFTKDDLKIEVKQ